MKNKKDLMETIESWTEFLIENGSHYSDILYKTVWWHEIRILCWVLEIDCVPYWNKICKKHPHLGPQISHENDLLKLC